MPYPSKLLALPVLALLGVACARPLDLVADTSDAQSTQVVIVSAAGKLATSTPAGTVIPPTPTFSQDFSAILTPLAQTPVDAGTPSPAGMSPTPLLRPTRTPQPSVTPFPTLEIPPTPDRSQQAFQNPPTRTPSPPTPVPSRQTVATRAPTRTPSPTPADPNGDIATLATAAPIAVGSSVSGLLNGLSAVNVWSFDVANADDQISVTLNGPDADHYKLYLISPGRQQASAAQSFGANGRLIRYPARGEIGTWYVEVTTDGKKVPAGSYTLQVDVRTAAATATATPKA